MPIVAITVADAPCERALGTRTPPNKGQILEVALSLLGTGPNYDLYLHDTTPLYSLSLLRHNYFGTS